jgi:predicted metal-dependent hydrolase
MNIVGKVSTRDCISHQGEAIEYEIIHRPAVTSRIHLELDNDGTLQVVAPRRMSRRAIRKALQQDSHRVARYLAGARKQQLPDFRYVSGEEHLFLGKPYPLDVLTRPGHRAAVYLYSEGLRIISPDERTERIRTQLQNWYRKQAGQYFESRLAEISQYASWTGGKIPAMRLRRMKRSWGNCSAAGMITLNQHLVKAPPDLIDYVIAHEVCHLQQHNHSPDFYALQQQLFPNWRDARTALKENGHLYLHS